MKNQNTLFLSICIPAYGRIDYIRNTLNSIYSESNLLKVSLTEYEVVVSDNDPSKSLQILCTEFPYCNFHYYSTTCEGFMNSFHSISYGRGELLKLHNSQELWKENSLSTLIDFAKNNIRTKPLPFFTSGLLKDGCINEYNSFDDFNNRLSYLSSWSNGFCIWKDDLLIIDRNLPLDDIFPQTSLLFTQFDKKYYVVNDQPLFVTQFVRSRSGYDKFQAFSIKYLTIIDNAFKKGHISIATKNKIFNGIYNEFLPLLYFNVKIAKRESFKFYQSKEHIKVFFPNGSYNQIILFSFFVPFKILWRKVKIKYFL